MTHAFSIVDAAGLALNIFYALLALGVLVGLYFLVRWLKGLYDSFTDSGGQAERDISNMFTPHQDDGSVAPKDIAPKGTDPIDWIFMNHDLSEPT